MTERQPNEVPEQKQSQTSTYLKVETQARKCVREVLVQTRISVIFRDKFHVAVRAETIDCLSHHQSAGQCRSESGHDRLGGSQ